MADEKNLPPEHRADLDALAARHARRRLRAEAALDVPETWGGFPDWMRDALQGEGDNGLQAARLWDYVYGALPQPCTLDDLLDAAPLLDLDAEGVGRALDVLRRAEMVTGTPGALTIVNPAVPF